MGTFFVFGISIRHFVETLQSEPGVASGHLGLFLKFWTTVKYNNANGMPMMSQSDTPNTKHANHTKHKCKMHRECNAKKRKRKGRMAAQSNNQSTNQPMNE